VIEPSLPEPGVYVDEQVPVPPLPLRLQVVKVPDLVLDMLTVPVGVIDVPEPMSVMVTLQMVPVPARTVEGEQLTEVDVVRALTVIVAEPVPPLAQFRLDREYVPVIVFVPDDEGEYVTEHAEVSAPKVESVHVAEGLKLPPVGLTVNVTVP